MTADQLFCPSRRNGVRCGALMTGVPLSGWAKCQTCEMRFRMYMWADPKVTDHLLATWEGKNHMAGIHDFMRKIRSTAMHPELTGVG